MPEKLPVGSFSVRTRGGAGGATGTVLAEELFIGSPALARSPTDAMAEVELGEHGVEATALFLVSSLEANCKATYWQPVRRR